MTADLWLFASVVTKCLERMMLTLLRIEVDQHSDSFHFAY